MRRIGITTYVIKELSVIIAGAYSACYVCCILLKNNKERGRPLKRRELVKVLGLGAVAVGGLAACSDQSSSKKVADCPEPEKSESKPTADVASATVKDAPVEWKMVTTWP